MALIYIVEDEGDIREIETFALKNAGHNGVGFENSKDFYRKIQSILPDIVLLDIMLPDESGTNVLKKLRSNPDTKKLPVIMVTAKTQELDVIRGLDGGADDYIKKPFSVMELISRVNALLRRTETKEHQIYELDTLIINDEKREASIDGTPIELTYKEYELLRYLVKNKNIVLSREKIENNLWNFDYLGGTNAVDVYIRYLRKKIDDDYDIKLIHTVRGSGYVLKDR